MTDHNMGNRTNEQHYVTATNLRLMGPSGNQTAGTHTGETYETLSQPSSTRATAAYVRHGDQRVAVRTAAVGPRMDGIRWSSIWGGLAVALPLYLLLQLPLVATGIVDLSEGTSSNAWWSAAAALVAFLIGGIAAGATAVWHDADDGLLHGIVMWAVGLVALIALATFGRGIALGSFDISSAFDQFTNADLDAAAASGDTKEAANWAIVGLTSALVASAIGATIGSKMWPLRRTDVTEIRS